MRLVVVLDWPSPLQGSSFTQAELLGSHHTCGTEVQGNGPIDALRKLADRLEEIDSRHQSLPD